MSTHDDLEDILAAGRWRALEPLLVGADTETAKDVRRWYKARRAHWTREYTWTRWNDDPEVDGNACVRLLAVGLATPAQAAKWLGATVWGWKERPSDDALVRVAGTRGRAWCDEFLDRVTHATYGRDDEHRLGWIVRLAAPLVVEGKAAVPQGPVLGLSWANHHSAGGSAAKWRAYVEQHPERFGDQPREEPPEELLTDQLRDDPFLRPGLASALASPRALGIFDYHAAPGWELGPSVAALAAEGLLDRGEIVTGVLEALTRQDPAGTQRGLAKLLAALDLRGEDLAGRMPLVQGLLATNRGQVTAVLLPAALESAGPTDLEELAATVFARPEKAQRSLLLKTLLAPDAVTRWGREPVVAALRHAAEVPDQALSARAVKGLDALGVGPEPLVEEAPDDLWGPVEEEWPTTALEPVGGHEAALTEALSRHLAAPGPLQDALLWDAVVRWYAGAPRAVRAWAAAQHDSLGDVGRPPALRAVLPTTSPPSLSRHLELCEAVTSLHVDGKRKVGSWAISSRTVTQVIYSVLESETVLRLGSIPFLLSTPTHSDGLLALDVLAARLRAYDDVPVGPADLFVALLRLEQGVPDRARALDGLHAALWSPADDRRSLFGRGRKGPDAVELVRSWVAGGGLPRLTVRHDGSHVHIDPVTLPVPVDCFLGMPPSLVVGHRDGEHDEYYDWSVWPEADLGIAPTWADLLAAKTQRQFDQKARFPPRYLRMMASTRDAGLAVQHDVAATLCHADEDHRLTAVEAALRMMGDGQWDTDAYTACCRHMLADGELRLARLAHTWDQIILARGLQALWPTVEVVLGEAAALPRKPPGLAELLGMLRRYVGAVPAPSVPPSLRALAETSGSSKAKAEAEAYVAAVDARSRAGG